MNCKQYMVALLLQAMCVSAALAANNAVLIKGAMGVEVTVDDVLADASRLPPEARKQMLSNPNHVLQIAQALYIKRALAAKALNDKLDEKNAAVLKLAKERLLAEMYLLQAEGSEPDAVTLDKLCRAQYAANKETMVTPETVTARHILISSKKADARAQAEALLARIKAGKDFAKLAEELSDDPGSAKKGGSLGEFTKGRMVPAFDAAVFDLKKPGEVSGIIETEFGFHIARLDARKPAGLRAYDEVKDEIRKSVLSGLAKERRRSVSDPISADIVSDDDAIQAFAAGVQ